MSHGELKLLRAGLENIAEREALKVLESKRVGPREYTMTLELFRRGEISLWLTYNFHKSESGNFFVDYSFAINWPRAQVLRKLQHATADPPPVPLTPEIRAAREADYPIATLTISGDRRIFADPSPMAPSDDLDRLAGHLPKTLEMAISEIVPKFSSYCDPHVLSERCLAPASESKLSLHEFNVAAILAAAGHSQAFLDWRKEFEADPLEWKRELSARPAVPRYLDTLQRLAH